MQRVGFVLLMISLGAGRAWSASPDPKELAIPPGELTRARTLVDRLGSLDFIEREQAQSDLARMGRLALPVLARASIESASAEVRFRCQSLIPQASHAETQARLDAFLADADGKYDHHLPGWDQFRALVGPTAAARGVFADLIADPAERSLLFATARTDGRLADLVAARKQELYQRKFPRNGDAGTRKEPTLKEVLTVLFAESRVSNRSAVRSISTSVLMTTPTLAEAIGGKDEKAAVYKAIVLHWIDTRDDAVSMNQALNVATNLNLKEAATVGAKLLKLPAAPGFYRAQASMALARLGEKSALPAIEQLYTDETVILSMRRGVNAEPEEIQLRDVALAAAMLLTGQDPEAVGYTQRYKSVVGAATRMSYSNWYLPPDKRAAAFDSWKKWRAKNPTFGAKAD